MNKYFYIIIIFLFSSFFYKNLYKTKNDLVPVKIGSINLSSQGLERYVNELNYYLKEDFTSRNLADSLEALNQAGLKIATKLAVLKNIETLTDDPRLIRQGKYNFWKVVRKNLKKDWKKQLYNLIENGKYNSSLPSHQFFRLQSIIKSLYPQKTYTSFFKSEKKSNLPMFSYKRGEASEKSFNGKSLTILSFNICFTPDDMPLVFGGMLPWQQRIDKVASTIKDSGADIVCMQEIFDHNGYEALYDSLKDEYPHFYMHIGPWSFQGSFKSLGFGSGLMVASKYPLDNPQFIPFEKDNTHINRGVFSFQVLDKEGKAISHIYTTHLEPFEEGKKLRDKELEQIISQMESEKGETIPKILCGDLNLPPDEQISWIQNYFTHDLELERFYNEDNYFTSCDFTKFWVDPTSFEAKKEFLDYSLLYKKGSERFTITTNFIPTFKPQNPQAATSDHFGLLTKLQFNENVEL
jgi:endonuclease/exonuclease/phosphatase family metal-dependent hydrolase